MKQVKKRNWCIIGYPESLPERWEQKLIETGLPFSVSPLHDKDLKEDGSEGFKKAHYHIIVCYPGPTTFNTVLELAGTLNASNVKPIESVKGAYRYHTHKDNPEKAQYKDEDIRNFNGFDPLDYKDLTATELRQLSRECIHLINEKGIFEYSDLIDSLLSLAEADPEQSDLYDYATKNTIMLNNYLTSKRNKAEKAEKQKKEQFTRTKRAGDGQKSPLRELFGDKWADEEGVE